MSNLLPLVGQLTDQDFIALTLFCAWALLVWRHIRLKRAAAIMRERLERRNAWIAEMMRVFELAEEIADVGVWQYFPEDGRQVWSKGLREMFGANPEEGFLPGDAETLLSANGVDLVTMVSARRELCDPYSLRFVVMRLDGSMRVLALRALNIFNVAGEVRQVVAVVMDVTAQANREEDLVKSRDTALRAAQEARELANTDPLTRLANRRFVMAELDRQIMEAKKHCAPLTIIVIDIDKFKQINDRFGHTVGDEVICSVASLLREQARGGDTVGRIGGEEFVWIARGADCTIARILAERFRQAVDQSERIGLPKTTVSAGFAQLRDGDSALTLFARADQALFDAKDLGRNMVSMAA